MKNKAFFLGLLIMGILFFSASSCSKDDEPGVPVVSTTEATKISQTTAASGGNITNDGGATITAQGVAWSTSQSPTIDDSRTEDGNDGGSFASSISGLEPNTTYYVRAYATNSVGTGYGDAISFATLEEVVDADGNFYSTVIIGNQEWFAENLRTTVYNDGTPIPNIRGDLNWINLTTGAYAWYNNNEASYKETYGALYNWHAVEPGNLCPAGWHVPSDEDWRSLTDYVGGRSLAGGKLKSTRTAPDAHPRWQSPNTGATDEYGFSALPGGIRGENFNFIGIYGFWWSSTENSPEEAWRRFIDFDFVFVSRSHDFKHHGYSVRCVRDN